MRVTADKKLTDIILRNHLLLPVLDRFRVRLGFGEMTVAEICEENDIHLPFFLEVMNAFHDRKYEPQPDPELFPVPLTIAYLRNAHRYYTEQKVPGISEMIHRLVEGAGEWKGRLAAVTRFFDEYARELDNHIRREEEKVFPYALSVDHAFTTGNPEPGLIESIMECPISAYFREHEDVEEKLLDLKNILIKYVHPSLDQDLIRRILNELFELEADLNDHARLEDLILFPVLVPMEQALLGMAAGGRGR